MEPRDTAHMSRHLALSIKGQLRALNRALTEPEIVTATKAITAFIYSHRLRVENVTLQTKPFTESDGHEYFEVQAGRGTVFVCVTVY